MFSWGCVSARADKREAASKMTHRDTWSQVLEPTKTPHRDNQTCRTGRTVRASPKTHGRFPGTDCPERRGRYLPRVTHLGVRWADGRASQNVSNESKMRRGSPVPHSAHRGFAPKGFEQGWTKPRHRVKIVNSVDSAVVALQIAEMRTVPANQIIQ